MVGLSIKKKYFTKHNPIMNMFGNATMVKARVTID